MGSFKSFAATLDFSTRANRRKAVAVIIGILEKIRIAEESYMDRIPENFQCGDAYAAADYSVDSLIDAIVGLSDAY